MQRNAPAGGGKRHQLHARPVVKLLAALAVGSTGTLILGLQPVLLGALLSENRVDFDGLALMATIEMLAIGIGSASFALLLAARHMRIKAVALLAATALGHALTADASGVAALTLIRGLTGLAEGGLVAIAVELIARSATPGRHGGWFVILQTLAQCLLAAVLALAVVPYFGSQGGFYLLAGASLLPLIAVPLMRDTYPALPERHVAAGTASGRLKPAAALLVIFSLYLFIGAIWAFLEPIGAQSGIDAATVGIIVSTSLLVQVFGAMSATWLEPRLHYRSVIGGAAFVAVLIGIGFASAPSVGLFWVLSLATGFLWLFVVPWQISMSVDADPGRKAALLVPAAQLFGAAIGPAGASAFIVAGDVRPVAWFAAACALASLLLLISLVLMNHRRKGH